MATPHVFLLEDNESIGVLVDFMLPANYSLTHCTTCADARQQLTATSFDLLLIDIQLPDGSGADLLKEIRTDPASRNKSTRAVAFSAQAFMGRREELLATGFDTFLGKPFGRRDLLQCLEQAIV